MKILITGTSSGIGLETAKRFLKEGFEVYGFDKLENPIKDVNYHHFLLDLRDFCSFPELPKMDYCFFNAGSQNSEDDINNNLKATMACAEKYATAEGVKSVLFNASASARNGFEFPAYVASKAGLVGYMKNLAHRLAKNGTTVNSLSLGGVLTSSNAPVMEDKDAWEAIMKATPLKKWMSLEEVTSWVYFLLVTNRSMSGQDVLVDNGENDLNCTFVWPE